MDRLINKQYFRRFFAVLYISTGLGLFTTQVQAQSHVEVNHLNEVTHLEIPNIATSEYQIKKNKNSIELIVSGLDVASQDLLKGYTDRYIRKIEIAKNSSLSKDLITIYLNQDDIELFDYLTDSPSTLSMDFFVKDDKDKEDAEFEFTKSETLKKKHTKKEDSGQARGRGIASDEFIKTIDGITPTGHLDQIKMNAETQLKNNKTKKEDKTELLRIARLAKQDAQNILKFDTEKINFTKDSLIEGKNRIYIKYPTLISEAKFLDDILHKEIKYDFKRTEDGETKDFIKLNNFFVKEDYKSFLKAKRIFEKKYIKSKYDEMTHYMEADAYLKLYASEKSEIYFDRALKLYDALLYKYPKSDISERTLLLVAYLRLKDRNYFDASRNLRLYISRYEKSPLRENIELLLAQSLIRLNEFSDAKKIYLSLLESKVPDVKEAAYYNYGDVFFEQKDYAGAIAAYTQALQKYPKEDRAHPNLYYNMGEAHFLIGNYKESLNNFRIFVEQNPLNEYASYALTRMGEVFEMSEVPEKIWKGYFNECHFRFNNKMGGAIAKINLLYHQALIADETKFNFIINQMKSYLNTIDLVDANEYLTFKISDAYYERKDFESSMNLLIGYFKAGDIPTHAEKFHKRIGRSLAAQLKKFVAENKIEEGLSLFDKMDKLWFKKSQRIDYSFYKGEFFNSAGVYNKAIPEYEKYLSDFLKMQNREELDKSQRLPYLAEVYLRLSASYLAQSNLAKSQELIDKIKLDELDSDGLQGYHFLKAKQFALQEKWDPAIESLQQISHLNQSQALYLADLFDKKQKPQDSVHVLDQYLDKNKVENKTRFEFLKKKLSYLEKIDSKKYMDFLVRFYGEFKDKKYEFDREKYLLGSHYLQQEKNKEAEDVFSKIATTSYWSKMASESKESDQWNKKYKKYIDRIPAMSSEQEKR